MNARTTMIAAVSVAAVAASAAAIASAMHQARVSDRQPEVAARGSQVMPFDLGRTTHQFLPTPEGGQQTVTADDPDDSEQIRLIREHLVKEQAAFATGNFDGPAAIRGHQMPGLAALRAGAARITVTYSDIPAGASLTYATNEPALIEALHVWFAAQTSDHGSHAS
jgi:hypothetical protein